MKTRVAINGDVTWVDSQKEKIPASDEKNNTRLIRGLAFLTVLLISVAIGTSAFSVTQSDSASMNQYLVQNTDTDSDKDTTETEDPTDDYETPSEEK